MGVVNVDDIGSGLAKGLAITLEFAKDTELRDLRPVNGGNDFIDARYAVELIGQQRDMVPSLCEAAAASPDMDIARVSDDADPEGASQAQCTTFL